MKKRTIIAVSILLVVAGLVVGLILFMDKKKEDKPIPNDTTDIITPPMVGGIYDGSGSSNGKKYKLENDANNNGIADIGDEISLGSEHFHIVSYDGTKISALAKYNLYVGGDYVHGWEPYAYPTKIQDSTIPYKGITPFSSTSNKYSGSIVEEHVNNYINYLNEKNNGLNAKGRLLTKKELEILVNDGEPLSYDFITDKIDAKGYSWLYSTSYWLGTSDRDYNVWNMYSDGYLFTDKYTISDSFGVRPVIEIDA